MLTHAKAEPAKKGAPPGRAPPVLQRMPGNRLQRAAVIGRSDDACEREAERIAAQVTRPGAMEGTAAPAVPPPLAPGPQALPTPDTIQRAGLDDDFEGERPGEYLIQPARDFDAAATPPITPEFARRLGALRPAGRPLPGPLRAEMERAFGEPFAEVRIHTGTEAGALARGIRARAFTTGRDIVFADGAFRPETQGGRALVAHELTHVVQQRGPAGGAVAEAAPASVQRLDFDFEVPTSIGDVVRGLLRRYAPEIEPIFTQGPVGWLRDRLGGVFGGVFDAVSALNPGAYVDQMVEAFTRMVETAADIIGALISGDCEPMFGALNRIKTAVTEVAGAAWDKLSEFFRPVGDFFSDLWGSISAAGSAAIDWLRQAAGDVWDTITEIGEFIWDKTQPIRDYGLGAWTWIKEQLFGPADNAAQGDSRGGIIGWFSDKALEAWGWVKDQTRPVWEPVSEAIETINEMIPPAFVAELGQSMERFSQDIEQTTDDMEGGNSVAENREALAGILPSVEDIIATIRGAIVAAGTWVTGTIGTVAGKVTTFMSRLRASSILGALAGVLGWLETAIASLGNWARDKVAVLFDWYVRGFDFLTPFLRRIAEIVGQVISVAGDLLRLPQLILTAAWELIPECIREPIKTFIIEQILSRIPVFQQFAAIGNLWSRLQETALRILRALFVDGDIARAAWTYFSALLSLIGLPARLVAQILAKAASAIGLILQDPIGFLINTLRAMRLGFSQFFSNILTHLLGGITGWLFGHVREAGLTPPTEFTLRGVLGFVMQILDITVERVMQRLALRIGQDKVDRIRQVLDYATGVWNFVSVLISEGVAGLWRELQERLSNLWSLVLDSVIGWVTSRVIAAVTTRLLSFLDPSGIMAVINSCIAIYRAIESFVQQLRAMLEIVSRVLDGIGGIARGAIGAAATFLENAMARALPVAIAFLANQVGLGGLSRRIREFVEGVRERVNQAIDWIIDRGIRLGQGFLAMLERGASAVRSAAGAIRDWWRARKRFRTQSGEDHSVYLQGRGRDARVMIASDPQTYIQWIDSLDSVPAAQKATARQIAGRLDTAITAAANQPEAVPGAESADQPQTANHADIIQGLLDELGTETARFMPPSSAGESTRPIYGGTANDFGTSASVARLTSTPPTGGGAPSSSLSNRNWAALRPRMGNNSTYYIRGHLLNDNLGGPGNTWSNLTPLTQEANNRSRQSHLRGFEAHVKRAVLDQGRPVNFVCVANYGRGGRESQAAGFENLTSARARELGPAKSEIIADIIRAEASVPLTMDCSAHELNASGGSARQIWTHTVQNTVATEDAAYDVFEGAVPAKPTIQFNTLGDGEMENWLLAVTGIGQQTVRNFNAARAARRTRGVNLTSRRQVLALRVGDSNRPVFNSGQWTALTEAYTPGFAT